MPRKATKASAPATDVREVDIELGLDDADDEASLKARVGRAIGVPASQIPVARIVRRAIDARRGGVRLRVLVSLEEAPDASEMGKP
ncbi:MAG TPA: hypothetical protein VGO62_14405, partial [Myxococcota bacterium]